MSFAVGFGGGSTPRLLNILYWVAGVPCVAYALYLLCKNRKNGMAGGRSDVEYTVKMPFPAYEFSAVAPTFEGLYEQLHVAVETGKNIRDALSRWQKRAEVHDEPMFRLLRMYFSKIVVDLSTDEQWTDSARKLLSGIHDAGIRRDGRTTVVLGDVVPNGYFIEDSVDFERGDVADVKWASWYLGDKVIEKGLLVVRDNNTEEKERQ